MAQTVSMTTSEGEVPLYAVEADGGFGQAVIVLQEAFGVNAHIEDLCRRLAADGFLAVAPHLFHRTGDPELAYGDMESVRPHQQGLTREGLVADLKGAVDYLKARGVEQSKVGVVGFCMGGTVSFLAGVELPLGTAVTFYGGGIAQGRFGMPPLVDMVKDLQTPWLGLYGDHDLTIPSEQVEALRSRAREARVPVEIVRYPDAGHGFNCDARESYHEASATDAWRRAIGWLRSHLAK